MKKRAMCLMLGLMISCCGCGAKEAEESSVPASTEEKSDSEGGGYRVGAAVYDSESEEENLTLRTQYSYDRESLTYDLIWSDEFDVDGAPDETKWQYDYGGGKWGNNELQYYTTGDNCTVKDGNLEIELRKESVDGYEYTSTRLISKNKGDFLYGKVEVCAKLPTGKGTWPAIWMLPTGNAYGPWPASGEIDIMEHVAFDQDRIHQSVHTMSYNHTHNNQKTNNCVIEGVSDGYHVYGLEWLPDQLIFSVDGEELYTFNAFDETDDVTYKEWPFDKSMYLILNIAYGGDWGGQEGIDDECLPQTMYVDYVRVYQSEEINALVNAN